MKNSLRTSIVFLTVFLFLGLAASQQALAYTIQDFTSVGAGKVKKFKSQDFTLSTSNEVFTKKGKTDIVTMDFTFANNSAVDYQNFIATFKTKKKLIAGQGFQSIETSPGSGVFMNYANFNTVAAGGSTTATLSFMMKKESPKELMEKIQKSSVGAYGISGPAAATPEPHENLLILLSLMFMVWLYYRKQAENA